MLKYFTMLLVCKFVLAVYMFPTVKIEGGLLDKLADDSSKLYDADESKKENYQVDGNGETNDENQWMAANMKRKFFPQTAYNWLMYKQLSQDKYNSLLDVLRSLNDIQTNRDSEKNRENIPIPNRSLSMYKKKPVSSARILCEQLKRRGRRSIARLARLGLLPVNGNMKASRSLLPTC